MNPWHNELAPVLSLDGTWDFSLADQSGTIQVPGCWEAQGYARRVDGPATYRRQIEVPTGWQGQRIELQFDAVSYYAEIEVNGQAVGSHTGSWTAFALDVTDAIRPGADNEIALTVYKQGERFPLRESLAGFLPDVAVMFGGLWQSARLVAFPGPSLSDLSVLSDISGRVTIGAALHGADGLDAAIRLLAPDGREAARWQGSPQGSRLDTALTVSQPQHWQPGHPALYTAVIELAGADGPQAVVRQAFGFRQLSNAGEQLLFNGVPVCLRGALNWGWYPDILCPAPDDATIRDEFRRVREMGFNLMKLCLYVPSPRYFEIADEEGMLLWLELPLWLPEVTERLKQQAVIEYRDIVAAAHPHPSIILYSLGCELEANVDEDWLARLNDQLRGQVSDVLVCDNSGSGEAYGCLADMADFRDYHFYCEPQFMDALLDHFNRDWRKPRPLIFGEFNHADDYRDLDELKAVWGELPWWTSEQNPIHPLTKLAFSQQYERMSKLKLGVTRQELKALSRQQSYMVRKLILEKVRARTDLGGYVITGLRNTALGTSAVFDDLNRPKWPPDDFRMFNDESILLLGRSRARVWTIGDRPAPTDPQCFRAGQRTVFDLVLAHAGPPLSGGEWSWRILRGGHVVAQGAELVPGPQPGGAPRSLGRFVYDAPPTQQPLALTLEATLHTRQKTVRNRWPLWVFPEITSWPEGIGLFDPAGTLATGLDDLAAAAARIEKPDGSLALLITNVLNADILAYLRDGGRVLLLQQGDRPLPALARSFWPNAIKLIEDHPVMNEFPHAGFTDMQFYGMATDWTLLTDSLDAVVPGIADLRPLLRRLDTVQFTLSDYLFEAQVGAGRLMATTLRFQGGMGDQPASLRFQVAARWLLARLLDWLRGEG